MRYLLENNEELPFYEMADIWIKDLFLVHKLNLINKKYCFTKEDLFLLQDSDTVSAMITGYSSIVDNVFYAYHNQGTEVYTWNWYKGGYFETFINKKQAFQLKRIKNWIFPSEGAKQSYIKTSTEDMLEEIPNCNFYVAYNGYKTKEVLVPDSSFISLLEEIDNKKMIFVSTTLLYKSKGVERIPRIIKISKDLGMNPFWILIGDGEAHKEVEIEIEKSNLTTDDYVWFTDRFDNQDNIFRLFKKADFYIMMHYISVFDLAILQAMSYGCVPFLSEVGGNIELCAYDNGSLVNPYSDEDIANNLAEYIDGNYLAKKKTINERVIRDVFNNENFLKNYKNILQPRMVK